jgi:hypothetical protein
MLGGGLALTAGSNVQEEWHGRTVVGYCPYIYFSGCRQHRNLDRLHQQAELLMKGSLLQE